MSKEKVSQFCVEWFARKKVKGRYNKNTSRAMTEEKARENYVSMDKNREAVRLCRVIGIGGAPGICSFYRTETVIQNKRFEAREKQNYVAKLKDELGKVKEQEKYLESQIKKLEEELSE